MSDGLRPDVRPGPPPASPPNPPTPPTPPGPTGRPGPAERATPVTGLDRDPGRAVPVLAGAVFDAVLFDLDGTLIDSTPAVERTWARWGLEYGLAPAEWTFQHGVPARQMLAMLVPGDEIEEQFAVLERIETTDLDGVVLLPGAVEALDALPPGRAAIATSGTHALAGSRIRHTRLPVPAVLVTADDTPVGKPDPAPYRLAAERLGVDPRRCLVVEDAPAGLTAGRAAGCATLGLTTTYEAAELDADALVPDLGAVRFEVTPDGVRVARRPLSDGCRTLPT